VWDAARMNAAEMGGGIPEPFRSIVARCLEIDPGKRCDLSEIRQRLEPRTAFGEVDRYRGIMASAIPEAPKSTARWQRWIIPAAVVAATVFFIARGHQSNNSSEEKSSGKPTAVQQAPGDAAAVRSTPAQQSAAHAPAKPQGEVPPTGGAGTTLRAEATPKSEIVEQVMPQVIPSARRTIEGKIKVRAKVLVDVDGNVTEARLEDAGPSKYFARVALEAARRWKFAPAEDRSEERKWTLRFMFTRERTTVAAERSH